LAAPASQSRKAKILYKIRVKESWGKGSSPTEPIAKEESKAFGPGLLY